MNKGFPGQYYDAETGKNYNYFRDYDPTTGRYIESDPIGLAGGINTYVYGQSNAENNFDETGLKVNLEGYVFHNPLVIINLFALDWNLQNLGFNDDCFTIRVTGGDRYRDPKNSSIIRSSTTNKPIPESDPHSPHLVERGARAADFVVETNGHCSCNGKITNKDIDEALFDTDFLPANTAHNYPNEPHTHVALPPTSKYDYKPISPNG